MTGTARIVGLAYDEPAQLAADLHLNGVKRALVMAALERAENVGDQEVARLMFWELAVIDVLLVRANGASPWRGGTYDQYATHYRLAPETTPYVLERARETQDLRLKARYLEFALLLSEPRGRPWIEIQRDLLGVYRDYIDGCRTGAGNDPNCHAGVYIDHALHRVEPLFARRGVIPDADLQDWAGWVVKLAEDSRSFPVKDPHDAEQQRNRWVADYLRRLTVLPPEAASPDIRVRALQLLADAAAYYRSTPLNDHFEHSVAEVEAELRKHWGEGGTHEAMIRRQLDATVRRAEFHRSTGNGLITATFFRQARALVEKHRQYFTEADVAKLQVAEREALVAGESELKRVAFSIEIPKELMDFVRETPEATVQAIVTEAATAVPDRARIRKDVLEANEQAPLHALFGRTIIRPGKVVGESTGPEASVELDVEYRAMLQTQVLGIAIAAAVQKAAREIGLTPEHLVAPLTPLALDAGSLDLIRKGLERVIADDPVSATHILVPRIEDALRQHLKAIGVDTTDFVADVGDGTSRTDDATLGSLMRKTLPDGRTMRDYLGGDLWDHLDSALNSQTGPNLRNEFAHGLARPEHCTVIVAAIALLLLYQLAAVAGRATTADESAKESERNTTP